MNENQADAVDKDMFSLVRTAIELQSHKYIFKDGAWRRLWDDQKKQLLLMVANKLIEMGEVMIKRKPHSESKISYLDNDDEISSDQLISLLRTWKRIKEANEYKPIKIDYILSEGLGQVKI
jgi:hypothetical protein